jgi:hypothetical protein
MQNYKEIETRLANRQPFKGNSLTGIIKDDNYTKGYFVYSYGTLVAVYNYNILPESDGVALPWERVQRWVNPEKFSQTTTRQQNLIKRAWGLI